MRHRSQCFVWHILLSSLGYFVAVCRHAPQTSSRHGTNCQTAVRKPSSRAQRRRYRCCHAQCHWTCPSEMPVQSRVFLRCLFFALVDRCHPQCRSCGLALMRRTHVAAMYVACHVASGLHMSWVDVGVGLAEQHMLCLLLSSISSNRQLRPRFV